VRAGLLLPDGQRSISVASSTVSLTTSSSGGVSILALDLEMNVTQSRSSSGQYFLSVGLSSGLVDSGIALHGCSDRQPSGVVVTEVPACSHVRPDAVRAACKFDVAATGDDAYAASAAVAADVYASLFVGSAGDADTVTRHRSGSSGLSGRTIGGIVVGVVVGVVVVVTGVVGVSLALRSSVKRPAAAGKVRPNVAGSVCNRCVHRRYHGAMCCREQPGTAASAPGQQQQQSLDNRHQHPAVGSQQGEMYAI
jgi:hypothetical protein